MSFVGWAKRSVPTEPMALSEFLREMVGTARMRAFTDPTSRGVVLPRRDLLRALEGRSRDAAGDVGVERRPRRHHLEQPHAEIQRRADRDVRGGEVVAENPGAL